MMAREYESLQLSQMLNAMPPGPAQFMLLRLVVDNLSITNRQEVLGMIDILTAQAMEPEQPEPDLSGQARLISAQTRQREVEFDEQLQAERLNLARAELELKAVQARQTHEREIASISIDAEKAESDDVSKTAGAILDLAKAEKEEVGSQMRELMAAVERIRSEAPAIEAAGGEVPDLDSIVEMVVQRLPAPEAQQLSNDDIAPINIDRDGEGIITGINGRAVQRDDNGLVVGLV